MCGICGIVNSDSRTHIDEHLLIRMADVIRHRGPDDQGFFLTSQVGLGIRRLSIIDLSTGNQPIYNEDQTICVVFNGEIYNYIDLRELLEKQGHDFRTNSDTEVIAHAYEQWGDSCPEKLDGMFAFAIWDADKERIFIARDRFGKKPLYYCIFGGQLMFASEIKSILEISNIARRINSEALDVYLSLGYVPAPATLFKDIFKLPAGHYLTFSKGDLSIHKYWDLEFKIDSAQTTEEIRERVLELLANAVRVRLMSDVPLGALLSGGIDSSVVVGLMSQAMEHPVETFSVGFKEEELNELAYARMVSDHFNTCHHEYMVTSCTPELLQRIVWHLDEPIADPAVVPTLLVSELASEYVKVVLTGEGGDELFAGYDYYQVNNWAKKKRRFLPLINRQALPFLGRSLNFLLGRPRYHERTLWHWSLAEEAAMLAWIAIFTDPQKEKLYSSSFSRCFQTGSQAASIFQTYYSQAQTCEDLHRLMYTDIKVWLPDDLLMKVDKMSMASSLEARAPYLDHHLMEYVATIPANQKLTDSVSKRIFKNVVEDLLPPEVIRRPKQTFNAPIGRWLRDSLRPLAKEILSQGVLPNTNVFNLPYIQGQLWRGLENSEPGYAKQIWSLVVLGMWAQEYQVKWE